MKLAQKATHTSTELVVGPAVLVVSTLTAAEIGVPLVARAATLLLSAHHSRHQLHHHAHHPHHRSTTTAAGASMVMISVNSVVATEINIYTRALREHSVFLPFNVRFLIPVYGRDVAKVLRIC